MDDGTNARLVHNPHVSHGESWVVIRWEHIGPEPGEVLVLKSEVGYADALGDLFVDRPVQHAIYYATGTQCQDQDVMPDIRYYYTVFAQAPDGAWHKQGEERATVHEFRDEIRQVKLHEDGTLLAKLDTLRQGLFVRGAGGPS